MVPKKISNVNLQKSLRSIPKVLKSRVFFLIMLSVLMGSIEFEVLTSNVKFRFYLAPSPTAGLLQKIMNLI